jgi:hypothetical protein
MILRRLVGGLLGTRSATAPRSHAEPARFVLVLMRPSVGRHLEVFQEVMEVVAAGLSELGHPTSTRINEFVPGARHIVFGPRLLRAEDVESVPASTILYNFEPLHLPVSDERRAFVSHYAPRFIVWDYSAANVAYLAQLGIAARHVPLGYAPALTRVARAARQDIDVLFYGEVTARRAAVLDALRSMGLNIMAVTDTYGTERDALIARAKVVLNIHRDEDVRALETPRVFYLLANRKAVVSEAKVGVDVEPGLDACVVIAAHGDLASACVALVKDAGRRAALEEAGFRWVSARNEASILAAALDTASTA